MKKLFIMFLFIPFFGTAQDTIHIKKIKIVNTLINKSGKVMKVWIRNKRVKSGIITHVKNDVWEVNGKEMKRANKTDIYYFLRHD